MENTLLNLIPAAYLPEVHISQYDIGRTLTFNLKEGASDYNVPTGATVTVKATKPSGFGFAVPCTFSGGVVTLVVTETMTPEHGRFPAELSIVSGNTTIGTSNFIFNIERSPHPEGTIDGDAETIIPELTLLVERIEAAAEDVDEKAELFLNLSAEAETLPAGSLATANYSDGVLTLGIPRGYDGDDTKADAIVKSASGEVASFSDGGNGLLVKSLNVNIVPKQSGSGDPSPSNVRPISGYSDVNVNVAGGMIFDPSTQGTMGEAQGVGWWINASNSVIEQGGASNKSFAIPCNPETKYYFEFDGTTTIFRIGFGKMADLSFIDSSSWAQLYNVRAFNESGKKSWVGESPSGATYLFIQIGSADFMADKLKIKAYEVAESYPISLGQTVYGGTLEVMSGKLTINSKYVDLGSLNWSKAWGETTIFRTTLSDGKNGINLVCSNYVTLTQGSLADKNNALFFKNAYYGDHALAIRDDRYTDATAFKNGVNGVQLVYELATPTEIQLTPTQVKTLLGNNNIFADSGSVEVEYRADTTLAYNELLSLIASL